MRSVSKKILKNKTLWWKYLISIEIMNFLLTTFRIYHDVDVNEPSIEHYRIKLYLSFFYPDLVSRILIKMR